MAIDEVREQGHIDLLLAPLVDNSKPTFTSFHKIELNMGNESSHLKWRNTVRKAGHKC